MSASFGTGTRTAVAERTGFIFLRPPPISFHWNYDFLDILKPKITFFGNAPCQDLAYGAWNYRKLLSKSAGLVLRAVRDKRSVRPSEKPIHFFLRGL